jgi:hypothetical protein
VGIVLAMHKGAQVSNNGFVSWTNSWDSNEPNQDRGFFQLLEFSLHFGGVSCKLITIAIWLLSTKIAPIVQGLNILSLLTLQVHEQ